MVQICSCMDHSEETMEVLADEARDLTIQCIGECSPYVVLPSTGNRETRIEVIDPGFTCIRDSVLGGTTPPGGSGRTQSQNDMIVPNDKVFMRFLVPQRYLDRNQRSTVSE